MVDTRRNNILFEMLRSFVSLAHTLNLSQTVRILSSTRQTVRRHIDILEEIRGEKLFELIDRQYQLTDSGLHSLGEAQNILARGDAWMSGEFEDFDGLQSIKINDTEVPELPLFYSQQHPLTRLWQDGTPLLQYGFKSWVNAKASIEDSAFAVIRPYCIIFRRVQENWLCVEVGEKSALSTWFGWAWTKSSIGKVLEHTAAGSNSGDYLLRAYDDVYATGSARYDHQHRRVPRVSDGPLIPISLQRLLLACKFPDGEFGLVTLSDRTYQLEIPGLSPEQIQSMPQDLLMEFNPPADE